MAENIVFDLKLPIFSLFLSLDLMGHIRLVKLSRKSCMAYSLHFCLFIAQLLLWRHFALQVLVFLFIDILLFVHLEVFFDPFFLLLLALILGWTVVGKINDLLFNDFFYN